jgi:hypothetical protein
MNKFRFALVACLLAGAVVLAGACKSGSGGQSSPTEAYKTLYAAVQRKDVETVKKIMSKSTIKFMTGAAEMQKKPFDQVIANGTIESNLSPTMPQLCKERIKDKWGALEVRGASGKWEDVPFVLEDGQWKVAVGDIFEGTYQKPGDTICMQPQPNVPPTSAPGPNPPTGSGGPANSNTAPAPRQMPGAPAPIKPPTKAEPTPGKP